MACRCDRPMPQEDGDCLKCGRETPAHAELMRVGKELRPLVDRYVDALELIGAGENSDR